MALYYIVATIVITFKYDHLIFNSNGAKNQLKSLIYSSILMIALNYIVSTTVITFIYGHLRFFNFYGAKNPPKS